MAQIQTVLSCISSVQFSTAFQRRSLKEATGNQRGSNPNRAHAWSVSLSGQPYAVTKCSKESFRPIYSGEGESRFSFGRSCSSWPARVQRMPPLRNFLPFGTLQLRRGLDLHFSSARADSSIQARAMSTPPVIEVSPPWRPALGDIVIEPTARHTATVVFCMDWATLVEGWAEIVPAFGLKHVKWILPTAESRPITINGGFPMNGWFDVLGLGPSTKEDMRGLDRAAAHVISIMAKEKAKAGPDSSVRYAVGGFSQGGSLALHVATSLTYGKYLDGKPAPSIPLSAAACISGWLSGSDVLAKGRKDLDATVLDRASRLPILHCHGTADPVVNFQFGKLTADTLKVALGFSKTKFNAYNGVGHHVNPQEVADIKAWLLEHLPAA